MSLGLLSGGQGAVLLNDANSLTRTALSEDGGLTMFDAKGSFVWSAGFDGLSKEEQETVRKLIQKMPRP